MKNAGVIRRIDNLGRVVLPIHFRKKANLNENDDVEITIDEYDQLIISKYEALLGNAKLLSNIAISLYQVIKGTILIVDLDKIVSSYGNKSNIYQVDMPISKDLYNRIYRDPSTLPSFKIIEDVIEDNSTITYPIYGRNGNVLGAIVYIYEKDLLENVSKILSSYAILISEMLR